ncbi:MAG: bifunctional demethylmenaquinone methyltransferase/2-methoxy-6-polyprenyl-1,4-benzoquinol methylase UbiE [Bacteroidia bacterium]
MSSRANIIPYEELNLSKKEQVRRMFNNIAHRYDFMNRLLTLRIDTLWRRKAINLVKQYEPKDILDVATGTGDFAVEMMRLKPRKVIGIDIAEVMLELGRKKMERKGLSKVIELKEADSENLPFPDNSFDLVSSAFGVRNFEDLEKGLSEMLRVLRPGGRILVLECSDPENMPFKSLYKAYMNKICPAIGSVFSEGKAYNYLNRSVGAFPTGSAFISILDKAGYINAHHYPQSMGIASIYIAQKKGVEK